MKIYTVYLYNYQKYNYKHQKFKSFIDVDKAIKYCNQKNLQYDGDFHYQIEIEQIQE